MKLVKSDLYNTNNMIDNINEVISKNEKILSSINNFIFTSNKTLIGKGYDSIRNKMNLYCDALIKQNKLFNILLNNVTCADNYLINYMQEYDELDDSKIEEFQMVISNLNKAINEIRSNISSLNSESISQNDTDIGLISRLNGNLETYEEEYKINKKILETLNGLSSADNEASNYINDVIEDISKYKNAINDINVTAM